MSAPRISAFTVTRSTQQAPAPDGTGDWREQAACREWDFQLKGDPFFTDDRGRDPWADARAVCEDCPVRTTCLEAALSRREPHGLFGGLDPDQRRQIIRRRNRYQAVSS